MIESDSGDALVVGGLGLLKSLIRQAQEGTSAMQLCHPAAALLGCRSRSSADSSPGRWRWRWPIGGPGEESAARNARRSDGGARRTWPTASTCPGRP